MDKMDEYNYRITALEQSIRDLTRVTLSVERLSSDVKNMSDEIRKQGFKLEKINDKPSKKGDIILCDILLAITGLLIGFLLFNI